MMTTYCISYGTKDYGDAFVVREFVSLAGRVFPMLGPLVCHETIEEARASVPLGCVRLARHPSDDPVIVEVWL